MPIVPKLVMIMQETCCETGCCDILLQFTFIIVSVASLYIKRNLEIPQRKWHIWFLDVSKQVVASFAVKAIYALASLWNNYVIDSNSNIISNEYEWRLAESIVDATLLVALMSAFLWLLEHYIERRNLSSIRHGEYGEPFQLNRWILQMFVFLMLLLGSKGICLFILFQYPSIFVKVAKWILIPVASFTFLRKAIVAFVVPALGSIWLFWIMDNFIKSKLKNSNLDISDGWQFLDAEEKQETTPSKVSSSEEEALDPSSISENWQFLHSNDLRKEIGNTRINYSSIPIKNYFSGLYHKFQGFGRWEPILHEEEEEENFQAESNNDRS